MGKIYQALLWGDLVSGFGAEKQHYLLQHVRARTRKTEILWIFSGIQTANALNIGIRIAQKSLYKPTLTNLVLGFDSSPLLL